LCCRGFLSRNLRVLSEPAGGVNSLFGLSASVATPSNFIRPRHLRSWKEFVAGDV